MMAAVVEVAVAMDTSTITTSMITTIIININNTRNRIFLSNTRLIIPLVRRVGKR